MAVRHDRFGRYALLRTWEVDGAIVVGVHLVDHVLQLGLGRVLA